MEHGTPVILVITYISDTIYCVNAYSFSEVTRLKYNRLNDMTRNYWSYLWQNTFLSGALAFPCRFEYPILTTGKNLLSRPNYMILNCCSLNGWVQPRRKQKRCSIALIAGNRLHLMCPSHMKLNYCALYRNRLYDGMLDGMHLGLWRITSTCTMMAAPLGKPAL